MRASDLAEVAIMGAASPLEALRASMSNSSHAVTALDADGRVICMFGVGSHGFLSNEGAPWMLASDLLRSHAKDLQRRAPAYVAAMLDLYPELHNVVDARADATIRWLEWLGFTVGRPEPIGVGGAPMCRFSMVQGVERRRDPLRIRAFRRSDIRTIEANPSFDLPLDQLTDEVVGALEKLPSFTATVAGRIVGCAGLVPRDGGHEVWAYFAPRAAMLPMFNACRRFLDGCAGPVWALVDEPSQRWARLMRFKPTGETREVYGNRTLPIYLRG